VNAGIGAWLKPRERSPDPHKALKVRAVVFETSLAAKVQATLEAIYLPAVKF
jgi:hypothetical protein